MPANSHYARMNSTEVLFILKDACGYLDSWSEGGFESPWIQCIITFLQMPSEAHPFYNTPSGLTLPL